MIASTRKAATLSESLLDAMEAGDVEAARVAHDAIGRLRTPSSSPTDRVRVVDIGMRRKATRSE